MPVHNDELNRRANEIVAQAMSCYIHTGAPGAAYTDNRVANVAAAVVNAADWSGAVAGDVAYDAHLDFGSLHASDEVTVTAWTLLRGVQLVADGVFSADIAVPADQPFRIRTGTIRINADSV